VDRSEAILVLQAFRQGTSDVADVTFADALQTVALDPELAAWWEAQQDFDRSVVLKLGEVPVPDDLRARLLAGDKVISLPPQQMRLLPWLAAAALVAILCVAGTVMQVAGSTPLSQFDYQASVLPLIRDNAPDLAMTSTDHNDVLAWLKQRKAPMGKLTASMMSAPTIGCQKYFVHGHMVSLVCFTLSDGREAHLFIVDQKGLADPPSNTQPELQQIGNWSTAAWSDGKMSYLLASTAGPDAIKQLL
jgi:hypothetical protein